MSENRTWKNYLRLLTAAEVSRLSRYCDVLIQLIPLDHDDRLVYKFLNCPKKETVKDIKEIGQEHIDPNISTSILLNGNLNYSYDIQGLLQSLSSKVIRSSRVICVIYNPYLAWLYRIATKLGLRNGPIPSTFITVSNLRHIVKLAGFDIVAMRSTGYFPFRMFGIGDVVNKILPTIPLIRWLAWTTVVVMRPIKQSESMPSLTIVVPARNEQGNIQNCMKRLPKYPGTDVEVIFVEGHSRDDTWGEIQKILRNNPRPELAVSAYQQTGVGKNDAVMLGFSKASKDLLTILDADLSMPPEVLDTFYEAYCRGHGDFLNGNRLVYPIENKAMRFLNQLGNSFFAKMLSIALEIDIGDSLCGTKLISRQDYKRLLKWLEDFGDFDPFGDFQLLFGASVLCLGVTDVPIRYRARSYGSTNISRFKHGWLLLKMTAVGFLRLRLGVVKV